MIDNESVNEYISQARDLAVKFTSVGLNVSERKNCLQNCSWTPCQPST